MIGWHIAAVMIWCALLVMVVLVRHLVDLHDYAERHRQEEERARWRRDRPE